MKIKPGSAWLWIRMPEKNYYAHVRVDERGYSNVTMVDPVPNKLGDECYGELSHATSVDHAARKFADGMLRDREKYFGSKNWRPSREITKRLWKNRSRRLAEAKRKIESR